MDKGKVLITGGSGLIGSKLIPLLEEHGYATAILSRSKGDKNSPKTFLWSITEEKIDPKAIEWADIIIHLAGANVGEKRWTKSRKKAILESRTKSSNLLKKAIQESEKTDLIFISASAIGIYDTDAGKEMDEYSEHGSDFLAHVTQEWEKAVDEINPLVRRIAKIRTGVVLSTEGGALAQLTMPVKFYIGAPIGSGKQIVSWIHMDDLCKIYLECIENEKLTGPINAVAPNAASNAEMTKAIAKTLKRPLWLPNIPGFVLKLILGEMAQIVLASTHVVPKTLTDNNFKFKYPKLTEALEDLLLKKD